MAYTPPGSPPGGFVLLRESPGGGAPNPKETFQKTQRNCLEIDLGCSPVLGRDGGEVLHITEMPP